MSFSYKSSKWVLTLAICSTIITGLSFASNGLWFWWWYPANYEASLNLADDSSLPADKAKFLQEYRDKVATITGEPRYIFKKPNLDTKKQLVILDGLITRFSDLANFQRQKWHIKRVCNNSQDKKWNTNSIK